MKINVERTHNEPTEVIKERIDQQIESIKNRFEQYIKSVDIAWNDNELSGRVAAYGQTADFKSCVLDDKVSLELDVPWPLAPMKSKIVSMINFRLDKICRNKKA